MKKLIPILGLLLILISWSVSHACNKADTLFKIERSKNGNVVQYDACLLNDGVLSDTDPVSAYWMLENGQREDLNALEKNFAYGIKSEKRIGKDKVQISLAALSNRKVIVEKDHDQYRAITSINGKQSILERIYVKSEQRLVGPAKVICIDVFGRTLASNTPVQERIVPKG